MNKYDDSYIGKRFGHLTVERVYKKSFPATGKTQSMFLCKCDCGRIKEEIASLVANGYIVSCGCNLKVKKKGIRKKIQDRNYVATQTALIVLILIASGTDFFQATRNMI